VANVVALIVLHDDAYHLKGVIRACAPVPALVCISRFAFDGTDGDWQRSVRLAEEAGAMVVVGDWKTESAHRSASLICAIEAGYTHALIPDSDEFLEPELLKHLLGFAEGDLADVVRVSMETYWHDPRHVVRPREALRPVMLVKLSTTRHVQIREYAGPREVVLPESFGILHHLSWAGPRDRMLRKVGCWGHRTEVASNWFTDVYLGWLNDPTIRQLHPTHPHCYDHIVRIPKPAVLEGCWDEIPSFEDPVFTGPTLKTSVIIPLYGGPDDIRACLASLQPLVRKPVPKGKKASSELGPPAVFEEVVVVDDCSPDDAADVVEKEFPWVKLTRSAKNGGFGAACNIGAKACAKSSEAIFFLNSDTIVCRAGILPLMHTLASSGSVGASGPMTNNAGYGHMVSVTYEDEDGIELFCKDFSNRVAEDKDVSMLVGFALAVRRSVFEQLGGFDEAFYPGLWEDTDLCYRIQRARYRCVKSQRAFVHHKLNQSLRRMKEPIGAVMARGEARFRGKHAEDIATGFASHLAGDAIEPVHFDASKHPDVVRAELGRLRPVANIGLSMIVKNGGEYIRDLAASVQGIYTQMVAVDTGSTDDTKQILKDHGFEVYDFTYEGLFDFAAARNAALSHMRTKWIMALDADDYLPLMSAAQILRTVANSPAQIGAYVLPIQFPLEKGNTRVDHVKIWRHHPDIRWDFRLHEQILGAIQATGGQVARIEGAEIIHLNYDVTPEGQAAKKARDWPLLHLMVEERPDCPYAAFCMGMTKEDDKQFEDGIRWMDRCLELCSGGQSIERKAHLIKARALKRMERHEESAIALRAGIATFPDDPELNYSLAVHYMETGRFAEAIDRLGAMQTDTSDHFGSIDRGVLGPKRGLVYAKCLVGLDRYREAVPELRQLIAAGWAEGADILFTAALDRGDFRTADEALGAALRFAGRGEAWMAARIALGEARGEDPEGLLYSHIQTFPNEPAAYLLLARRLLARGDEIGAYPLLLALNDFGIGEGAYCAGIIHAKRRQFNQAHAFAVRAAQLDPESNSARELVEGTRRALQEDPLRAADQGNSNNPALELHRCVERQLESEPLPWPSKLAHWIPENRYPMALSENSQSYYLYLHALVKVLSPQTVLELGTCDGGSAFFMMLGLGPEARLTTVDIGTNRPWQLEPFRQDPRLRVIVGNDLELSADEVGGAQTIDLLFIDTLHEEGHVKKELERYLPLVKPGGVIVMDDIRLNEGMERVWMSLDLPKVEVGPQYHWSGFGLAVVGYPSALPGQ